MKKITLILILAILISLVVVTPGLAKVGGDNPGNACENITGSGLFRMRGFHIRNYHAQGSGIPYGPVVGFYKLCIDTGP